MLDTAGRLRKHVYHLADKIGVRSVFNYENLERARGYIEETLREIGYPTTYDVFQADRREYRNVVAERKGTQAPERIFVLGAHYDTVMGSPGADDNASGVAVLLEVARAIYAEDPKVTVRFVGFVLEEPPYFRTPSMGSVVHARKSKERGDSIIGMASLEMVGYFRDGPGSQGFPLPFMRWFYPDRGDFIALGGNLRSRSLVRTLAKLLYATGEIPVEWIALPFVPGAALSDNWAFWKEGYRALMITDTAFFRNPHYHLSSDHPETLDYDRMARLVKALSHALLDARLRLNQ